MDLRDRDAPPDQRQAVAETHPEQPAPGERVQRLDDLVAGTERIRERIEPDGDPRPDVLEEGGEHRAADEERHEAADDEADPGRRGVEHEQEHPEEQQRGAEVALDHDDAERDGPHGSHRHQVRDGREADRPDARVLLDEQGAVLREVPGEEHDEDHLEQFRRLTAERADDEGEPLPADVRAEHERQQEERDAGRGPGVLVLAEPAVRADNDRERRRDGQRQEQPDELDLAEPFGAEEPRPDEVLRQPLHQQQADPTKHPDSGQQHLVRPPPRDDEREVRREQRAEVEGEGHGIQRHPEREVEQVGAVSRAPPDGRTK